MNKNEKIEALEELCALRDKLCHVMTWQAISEDPVNIETHLKWESMKAEEIELRKKISELESN
jgi:hypothetical protein